MRYNFNGRACFDDTEFSELVEVDADEIIEWACEANSDENGWLSDLLTFYDRKFGLSFKVKVTNYDDEEYYVGKFRPVEPVQVDKDGKYDKDYYIKKCIYDIQKEFYEHCLDEEWARDNIGSVGEHNADQREEWESMKADEWWDEHH